jgi:hypothetical protein
MSAPEPISARLMTNADLFVGTDDDDHVVISASRPDCEGAPIWELPLTVDQVG